MVQSLHTGANASLKRPEGPEPNERFDIGRKERSMKTTIYQEAKNLLKTQAKEIKRTSTDKGYIRYEIDQQVDSICRQFNWYAMKETISEKQAKQYQNWLCSFACTLKP